MSVKHKRNAPCWCGSGMKYKKCHYGREQEERLSLGEVAEFIKSIKAKRYCSVPDSLKDSCSKNIIKAHTISKSGCLSDIADDTNHVLGLKPNISSMKKHKGVLGPKKIGINQASTFTGFCSYHDSSIFSPLEDKGFIATEEQCFLLAYRSIARDVYTKSDPEKFINFLRNSDRGMSLKEQVNVQAFSKVLDITTALDKKEFTEYKVKFDEYLIKKDFNQLSHFIIVFKQPPPVMVSAMIAPNIDFSGNSIQENTNPKAVLQHVMFNSFSNEGKGFVVFSWLIQDEIIKNFVGSLKNIEQHKMLSALISFFFIYAENVYISPSWWSGLTEIQQKSIIKKIPQGIFSSPHKHSLCKEIEEFGTFEVVNSKCINF